MISSSRHPVNVYGVVQRSMVGLGVRRPADTLTDPADGVVQGLASHLGHLLVQVVVGRLEDLDLLVHGHCRLNGDHFTNNISLVLAFNNSLWNRVRTVVKSCNQFSCIVFQAKVEIQFHFFLLPYTSALNERKTFRFTQVLTWKDR